MERMAAKMEAGKEPSRKEVWTMFDRIADRYDLLNRLLSFGQDVVWRKRVSRYLPGGNRLKVLDVATGTADLIISMFQKRDNLESGIGVDMAEKMLDVGRQKLTRLGLDQKIQLQTGNAVELPFPPESFHALTISFGIRNVTDVSRALSEFQRAFRSGAIGNGRKSQSSSSVIRRSTRLTVITPISLGITVHGTGTGL